MDKTLNKFVAQHLWSEAVLDYPWWRRYLIIAARYLYVVLDDLAKGELTLRAMSLVYTSLLSLVPLMAVSFSVLKAFGMHNKQLEPVLLQFLAPMGEKGVEITSQVIGFIDNVKISVLGSFGIALLFYTAISLIQKIESTFNYIWRLDQHRSIGRRFADYGSVMLIGPLLVFTAIGLSARVLSGGLADEGLWQRGGVGHRQRALCHLLGLCHSHSIYDVDVYQLADSAGGLQYCFLCAAPGVCRPRPAQR